MTVSLIDFSHAAATPQVLSDLHYWDLELDLAKALRSQVLKSKKCQKGKTVKNKDYNKNASENKKCLSKAKNASDQLEAPQTLRGVFFAVWFFQVYMIYIYIYILVGGAITILKNIY